MTHNPAQKASRAALKVKVAKKTCDAPEAVYCGFSRLRGGV